MKNTSVEFLTKLQEHIGYEFYQKPNTFIRPTQIESDVATHLGNILELIKTNRLADLQSYINDDWATTPNKNYTYKLRDKISSEIRHNINYIKNIENND
jgi:hypothetical protein